MWFGKGIFVYANQLEDELWSLLDFFIIRFYFMYFSLLRLLKVLVFAVAIFLFGLLPSYTYAETEELRPHTNNPILAIVDGEPLTLEDLKNAQIHDVMVRLHQVQSQVLKEAVLAKLTKNHPELKLENEVLYPARVMLFVFTKTHQGLKRWVR